MLALVTGVVGLLVYGFWPVPVEVDAVVVERGSFEITADDDGETRIREKYIVTSPVAGKLLRVELHAGDPVSKGETLIVRIDPGDPDPLDARSQAEAEARVRVAEAACELAAARRVRSEEALKLAQHDYERSSNLLDKQALPRGEFDRIEHQLHMAQADLRSSEFAVQVADFECEFARAALVRGQQDQDGGQVETMVTVNSPIDGRVLRVFTEDAGVVSKGTPIMELGDPRDLEMVIDVLSTEAVEIKPGARVYIDHWGGEGSLDGTVRIVEPAAFLKVSALGVEEKRVNVIADFRDAYECCEALGDGFRIEARIVVTTVENVTTVPAGVLFRHAHSWHAYRIVDGRAQLQPVSIGKSNGLDTEITKGLSPGDVVVLHPTDQVTDGVALSASP